MFLGAVVGRLALRINAANVADMNAVVVMPFYPVAGLFNWPVVHYLAVPFNDKVIAGRTPIKHLLMIAVNAVSRCLYAARCGVQYDVVNWSHGQMG